MICTADLGHPCDAGGEDDNGQPIPCASCAEYMRESEAHARYEWNGASEEERDPERYARELRECGRGHLLR